MGFVRFCCGSSLGSVRVLLVSRTSGQIQSRSTTQFGFWSTNGPRLGSGQVMKRFGSTRPNRVDSVKLSQLSRSTQSTRSNSGQQ
ncbi:hypothetical protein Hanom_Chr02g00148081 [Helianthus anomalus]